MTALYILLGIVALFLTALHYRDEIKSAFKKVTGKKPVEAEVVETAPVVVATPVEPITVDQEPVYFKGINLDHYKNDPKGGILLTIRVGRKLTDDEFAYAQAQGVFFEPPAAPLPAVDKSGFDFKTGGGKVLVNPVNAKTFYRFRAEVIPGTATSRMDFFGAPSQFFPKYAIVIRDGQGKVVMEKGTLEEMVSTPYVAEHKLINPTPGHYTIDIAVSHPGSLGGQFQQWDR